MTQAPSRRRYAGIIGTLRSDNSDVHENVAEKQSSLYFKLFRDYPSSPHHLKEGDFGWSWREGNVLKFGQRWHRFIALPFLFPSKLKIRSFHVAVVQWRQRNVQKRVMHVQSCCFAHLTYCFLTFPLPSSSWFRKVPYAGVMPSLPSLWVDHKKITRKGSKLVPRVFSLFNGTCPTSSPSSKYEHRRTSALLRNIRNIRICMGKKTLSFL